MKEVSRFTVVGLGEVLWDLLPGGKQLGGAPANFAYHAHALGTDAVVASCIGDDQLGRDVVDLLGRHGFELGYLAKDSGHPTGTVSVKLDAQGKPNYIIHENVAWDFMPSTPDLLELAKRTDAVCFGTLAQRSPVTRETIGRFLKATRPECVRLFDINLRQAYYDEATIRRSLGLSDALKLNDEELPIVAKLLAIPGPQDQVLDSLIGEFSLKAVALTRGDKGSLLRAPEGSSEHPGCVPDRIADTVGAGDCFSAVFVMGLLRGQALDAINEQANRLASYVCSQEGAMPPMLEGLKPLH